MTSATARSSAEAAIKQIEDAHRLEEERVVVLRPLPSALQHRLEPMRLGHGDAASVEVMHGRAQRLQRRIAIQAEARREHLEGHEPGRMRELRAVEIETDRVLGLVSRVL